MTTLMEPPAPTEEEVEEVEEVAENPEYRAGMIDRLALLPIPPIQIVRDSGVHSETCQITPEVASALLTHRRFQRDVSWPTVRRYARDMLAGNWKLTGQSMILSGTDGWKIEGDFLYLLDGRGTYSDIEAEDMQHRLLAVCISDVTITAQVVWGVDPAVRSVIDTNKVRTLPDVLNYATELGIPVGDINRRTLAKAANRMQQIEQTWAEQKPLSPTIPESMSWLHDNIDMVASVGLAEEYREQLPPLGKPDITALVGYHLRTVFGDEAEESFVRKFATQAELPERHPYLVVRAVLGKMADKSSKVPRGSWKDQFRVVLNAASLALADKHPVTEAQIRTKPQGRTIPAPLVAEPHLGSVE